MANVAEASQKFNDAARELAEAIGPDADAASDGHCDQCGCGGFVFRVLHGPTCARDGCDHGIDHHLP